MQAIRQEPVDARILLKGFDFSFELPFNFSIYAEALREFCMFFDNVMQRFFGNFSV